MGYLKKNLFVVVVLLLIFSPASHAVDEDLELGIGYMKVDKLYMAKVDEFIKYAVNGDVDAMLRIITPDAVRLHGENVRKELTGKVVPFFSQYEKLHNVKQINPARDVLGHRGWSYYTYIVTKTNEVKPFAISVIEQNGKLVILNVDVANCMKGRHPFCP